MAKAGDISEVIGVRTGLLESVGFGLGLRTEVEIS